MAVDPGGGVLAVQGRERGFKDLEPPRSLLPPVRALKIYSFKPVSISALLGNDELLFIDDMDMVRRGTASVIPT